MKQQSSKRGPVDDLQKATENFSHRLKLIIMVVVAAVDWGCGSSEVEASEILIRFLGGSVPLD